MSFTLRKQAQTEPPIVGSFYSNSIERRRGTLFSILLIGLVLRLVGVNFGLPYLYHADEPALINHAMAHGTGDLNPHYFKLPALLGYLLFFLFGIYFLVGRWVGWFSSVESFATLFFTDPTSFYLIARLFLGVFMGTLTIYLTYRLGSRIRSKEVGIAAAFFLTFCFLHVRDSHYAVYDIPLTTGLTACALALAVLIDEGRMRHYVVFGILAGLSIGAKYNAALVILPYFFAHAIRCIRERLPFAQWLLHRYFLSGLALTFAFYALGNPFSLIDFRTFWNDISIQARTESTIGLWHHLNYSLREGMGSALLLLSLLGTVIAFLSREPRQVLLSVVVTVWFLFLQFFTQRYERYALPVTPFLVIGAALSVMRFSELVPIQVRRMTYAALCLGVVLVPTSAAVYSDYLWLQTDTRTLAKNWIESNIRPGSKIALDYPFHSPRLRFSEAQLRQKYGEVEGPLSAANRWRLDLLLKSYDKNKPSFDLYFLSDSKEKQPLFASPNLPFEMDWIRKEGVQYVVITRLEKDYEHPKFYQALFDQCELIQEFRPYRDPTVRYGLASVRQTAGATELRDLFARNRFGDLVQIFRISERFVT